MKAFFGRQQMAFYLTGRMITIQLDDTSEKVKGRVFLYDDSTKVLILKIWKDPAFHQEREEGSAESSDAV
eukprot:CAMPEP_0168609972 /NCGR_PEP_ID=MMETSP0449_2-20121227/1513_1 /TAXON_ID=1082188 /ORGANISM="Strombidium rassoulzadegani, Strain ras09" /LENGTH=69 /DNA_ID=CAMNT_0008650195 /DNA_START=35 /DNA_END=244 /DNA_ORIENTATION=-